MNKENIKKILNQSEETRRNLREVGKISLDMINQIHLTQGKDELWEKAVEINKLTEKIHMKLQLIESAICLQVITDK